MSKRKSNQITNYFCVGPPKRFSTENNTEKESDVYAKSGKSSTHSDTSPSPTTSCDVAEHYVTPSTNFSTFNLTLPQSELETTTPSSMNEGHVNSKDICQYKRSGIKLSDEDKFKVLTNQIWKPDQSFDFPIRKTGKQNRKFSLSWLHKFNWLAYSQQEDSAYCRLCLVFAPEEVGNTQAQQAIGQLVKCGFSSWQKALEKFENHQKSQYHCDSILKSDNFVQIKKDIKKPIDKTIDISKNKQAEQNRNILKPIIDTVIFCGRQNIALRSHRDHGLFDIENPPIENEGNFRALLRMRISSGDECLKNHFQSCGKNATYVSWNIQNQIIDACHEIIKSKIVEEIKSAKFFSVLADETTDVSTQEQFTLCVRYVKNDSSKQAYCIVENFLQFMPLEKLTGEYLASKVLEGLIDSGLDVNYLRGQGYDGASSMSGAFNGTQAYVREKCPKAIYVHCVSHSLNLAISKSSEVPSIRNCFGTIQKIWDFFNTPKRQAVLEKAVTETIPDTTKVKLKQLCPTRWIERHDSVMVMVELLPAVSEALGEIEEWGDNDTSSGSSMLLRAIQQSDFIIALISSEKLLSYTLKLSKTLQTENYDLSGAISYAEDVLSRVSKIRENADEEFKIILNKSKQTAEMLNTDIKLPRLTKGKQCHRVNVPADNCEEYFKRAVFIPWVDGFISNLKERFTKHKATLGNFSCLLPLKEDPSSTISITQESRKTQFLKLVEFYKEDLDFVSLNSILAEYELWNEKFQREEFQSQSTKQDRSTVFNNAIVALNYCDETFFPNINVLLKVLCTIPVTTCTAERSFSTLKRVKSYLRNSMKESRLNGLASLNIHREISVDPEEVLKILILKGPRKLNFVL